MPAKKRSIKSPPTSGTFDGSFWDQLHGTLEQALQSQRNSPITINECTAFRTMAFHTAIRMICDTFTCLPHCIYERLPNGGKRKAVDHPWYNVLHVQPNLDMDWGAFIKTEVNHYLVNGNAYIQLDWSQGGDLLAMVPALPTNITAVRPSKDSELLYIYEIDSIKATIAGNGMAHIKGLGFDGLKGYSPVQHMKNTLEFDQRAEKFELDFFEGGATPSGILKASMKVGDEAKKQIKDSFVNQARNRGIPVLPPWLDWISQGVNQEQAQWIEGRQLTEAQIYNLFGIPLNMVTGDGDQKEAYKQFVYRAVLPVVKSFEGELNRKIFPVNVDGSPNQYYCQFVVDGLLRADIQTRYAAYSIGRQWGWESANSVLEMEDKNPIEGGDVYMNPLNMVPASIDGKAVYLYQNPNDPSAKQKNPDQLPSDRPRDENRSLVDQFSPAVFEALRRMFTREQKNLEGLVGKPDYQVKTVEFYNRHKETLYLALEPTYVGVAAALNKDANRLALRSYCDAYCGSALMRALGGHLEATTEEQIVAESNDTVTKFVRSLNVNN